jgi:hypothetical protein
MKREGGGGGSDGVEVLEGEGAAFTAPIAPGLNVPPQLG